MTTEHRGWLATLAPAAYAVALTISVLADGPPTAHDQLFLWLLLGMAAASASAPRRIGRMLLEWLPLLALLVLYDVLRGAVSVPEAQAHLTPQLDVDRWLTGGSTPTNVLQDALYSPGHVRPWDVAIWAVYLSHFFTVWVVAAVIWSRAHARFARYAAGAVLLTLMAFATYWLYPAQPPWMAAEHGEIAPVSRIVPAVWGRLGVGDAGSLYGSRDLVNLVAAMPSLHAAYPVFVALSLWRGAGRWRVLLAAYPFAMGFALVYGGEHFVLDVVLGWIYAVAAWTATTRATAAPSASTASDSSSWWAWRRRKARRPIA